MSCLPLVLKRLVDDPSLNQSTVETIYLLVKTAGSETVASNLF